VDAAVDRDLDAIEGVYEEVRRSHAAAPPLVTVVTHCDLLEPKSTTLHHPAGAPGGDLAEKLGHVASAERAVATKVMARDRLRDHLVATVGVSTYMSWREDGTLRADERWRIDDLVATLFRHLPDAGRAELARATRARAVQIELATTLTRATSALCAGIAAAPIPVADIVPLTALQTGLVAGIAWIGGRSADRRGAAEFLASLGANVGFAFVLRETVRAILKVVTPGGGTVVSAGIAFGGTMAIGSAAQAYFIRGVSLEAARKVFRRGRKDPDPPC